MSPSGPLVVLCVNSGSSSLKTALFEVDRTGERALARAAHPVEWQHLNATDGSFLRPGTRFALRP